MKKTIFAILAMISTEIYAVPNQTENNYIIEVSSMGIRFGYNIGNWRVCTRVNGDYTAAVSKSLEKENDSVTYSYESEIGYQSNIEFGMGIDKYWKYEKSEFGIRSEVSYIYPFTNTNDHLRYNNTEIATCRIAIFADHSLGPILIGGSIGPTVTWNYQHYIYESTNNKGNSISYNRRTEKFDANIKSELFVRHEF